MKILGLIPARGGSKGVPHKNIKELAGKPLLQYTSEAALQAKGLSKVVLSTDDAEIAAVGKKLGLEVPFLRPSDLASDKAPTLPVIQHALQYYLSLNETYDAVCLLQPTSPFRTSKDIDAALEKFKTGKTDSLISVLPVPHEYNPHWVFEINSEKDTLKIATGENQIIPRRQELPAAFHRDGSIYITKSSIILNDQSIYGNSIGYYISQSAHYVNIDTMDDWAKAEQIMKQKNR